LSKTLSSLRIAVVGATGLVGAAMLRILAENNFPLKQIGAFASSRSTGIQLPYGNSSIIVQSESDLNDSYDLIFGFCSSGVTKSLHDRWQSFGKVVIDNSSAYRLTDGIPLVVPEVNLNALKHHTGWIANPNCSTIQMVRVLHALKKLGLHEVSVATYQSVSGAGRGGLGEWEAQQSGSISTEKLHGIMEGNVIPWIAQFDEEGTTFEEFKMKHETRKILELPTLAVTATCVRVPVSVSHSEAVHITLDQPTTRAEIIELLKSESGIIIRDELAGDVLPSPKEAEGTDDVFVGRIRTDPDDRRRIALWVVADNVRVGAATNAFRIARALFA